MNLDLLHDAHLHRNRLLRAAGQLLTTPPADPVLGEFLFAASGASAGPLHWLVYDGVSGQGTPALLWSVLAGLNRNETPTGLWTWSPAWRGAGSGDGEKAPFALGASAAFDSGGINRNRVQHLNADYLDGRGALEYLGTSAPSAGFVPVYGGTGQLAVADPSNDYDAVNKRTWQAGLTGMIVLAPCRVATTARFAGNRSGNVITATGVGAFVPDGVAVIAGDRVLLKDQGTGGTAVDNGVFVVTNPGGASVAAVLTRASDADSPGELTVGALVYIEAGTTNRATQWSCQHAPGETGGTIDINTQQQLWTKTFQQSAYTAGRGLVLNGLEFNFCQNADYTVGSLFWANAARTVTPLLPPASASNLFLRYSQILLMPEWAAITVAAISDWPNPILPGAAKTAGYHTRFGADAQTIENSLFADQAGTVVAPANTLAGATVGLGTASSPLMDVWSNLLRLKPTTGTTGTTAALLGTETSPTDSNLNHKRVVAWSTGEVKSWLNIQASDVGGVPTTRTLSIFGTAGQVTVGSGNTWDLSANRSWTIGLDLATLNGHWCTLHTDQSLSGKKAWYSVTADGSADLITVRVGESTEPTWKVKAGGSVLWGDGVAVASAAIDFASDRLRFSGKPVEFAPSAIIRATSALIGSGTPSTLLGLTINNDVQRVTAADLTSFVGDPYLPAGAVGYGASNDRLTGNAAVFHWDAVNRRLGVNTAPATETLDVLGSFKLANSVTSGTYPGLNASVTDTSASSANWTNRTLIGQSLAVLKSGAATYVTSGIVEGQRTAVNIANGSLSALFGHKLLIGVGQAVGGVTVDAVYGYYCQPSGASGSVGTVPTLYQFAAADRAAPWPQPVTHYAFRSANLTSASGATRTAGLALELSSSGSGERYNIYAPGTAANYLAGNLGLGVTTPAARLDFAVGTTVLAPARFAATSSTSSLLATPIAGALESRGDRLAFTDTTPTRRLLAYLDDTGFTNDVASRQEGGVVFGITDRISATLTADGYTEDLGADPFSVWVRFRVPTVFRGPNADSICGIGATATSTSSNGFILWIDSAGALKLTFYAAVPANTRVATASGFRTAYGGGIVDLVVVRDGATVPKIYVNGSPLTVSEGQTGSPPAWNFDIDSGFFLVGNTTGSNGSCTRFHRAAVFNRPLSQPEVLDLSRMGIASADQWGSTKPVFTDSFAAGVAGWVPTDAVNNTLAGAQTVNGSAGWATLTHSNVTGRADISRQNTGARINKTWGLRYRVWRATSEPGFFGVSVGLSSGASAKLAVAASTETQVLAFCTAPAQTGSPAIRIEPGTSAAATIADAIPVGAVYSVKDPTLYQVGAVVDLDLGIGCGSAFPDRSGRYHGAATGTTWTHYLPNCPVEMPSGSGTVSRGLRRYVQTIQAKDGDTVTVTHGLSTSNLTVSVWNATGQSVFAAVQRKVGSETTAIELGFALVGAPSTPVDFLVVIVG